MQVDPKPEPIPAAAGGKLQFGIRHLLGLMTYVGVVLGIATWQGPQTLVATLGLGLAWLSHWGAFQRLQAGRTQLILIGLAWVTYLVSLFVPCYGVLGLQAAYVYISLPVESILSTDGARIAPYAVPWVISIDLSNVFQLLLPLHFWRLSVGRGQVLSMISCLAMVGPWVTLVLEPGLEVGYYLWCASFMLLLIAVRVNRATLIGMVVLAVLLIAIFRFYPDSDPGPLKAIPKVTNRPPAAMSPTPTDTAGPRL
ncbi:MAG: hypothetical protein ACR2FY_08260 [Pirellulaceae bacterium]